MVEQKSSGDSGYNYFTDPKRNEIEQRQVIETNNFKKSHSSIPGINPRLRTTIIIASLTSATLCCGIAGSIYIIVNK